ncbi:MAG: tetratricopeptide repeat protein [Acidobacteria bacterium]|nr:tetratricopeptide repeat protein [Acidobacteriota bacterium]
MAKRIITAIIFLAVCFNTPNLSYSQNSPNQNTPKKQLEQIETLQNTEWLLVNTEHFAIVSNTDPERAKLIAYKLEQYRYIFSLLTPSLVATTPIPAKVHVYKDSSSYLAGLPKVEGQVISGYLQRGSDIISINDLFNITDSVSYHEYTHLLTRNDITYPLWFSEGIAEFYETIEVYDKQVRIGDINPSRLNLLKLGTLIPLEKMLSFRSYNQVLKETSLDLFYAQSWFFTHYMMMDDERRAKLIDFLNRQANEQSVQSAFKEAFKCDFEKLEENLNAYLAISKFKVFTFEFDPSKVDSDVEIISLSEEDKIKKLKELPQNTSNSPNLSFTLQKNKNTNTIAIIPNFSEFSKTFSLKTILNDRPVGLPPNNPEQTAKTKEALQRFNLANQLIEENKKDEALAEYEKVITLDNEFAPAYMQIGNIYSEKKLYDLARLAYEKARTVAPSYAGTYLNLAVTQYEQGKIDDAESSFRTALSLYPSSAASHLGLGNIYLQKRDYARARNEFNKTLSLVRGKGLEALNAQIGLGAVHFYQGFYEKAKENYSAAIKIDNYNGTWHRAYGDSCMMLKQYDQAKVAYLRAIGLNSRDTKAKASLEWIEKNDEYLRKNEEYLRNTKQKNSIKPKVEPAKNNFLSKKR